MWQKPEPAALRALLSCKKVLQCTALLLVEACGPQWLLRYSELPYGYISG
jgi:hypothetical protein